MVKVVVLGAGLAGLSAAHSLCGGGVGVTVLEQYATLGEFDFVHVIEAPDNETIARVSMELIARGNLKPLTLPTISVNDFISRLSLDRKP